MSNQTLEERVAAAVDRAADAAGNKSELARQLGVKVQSIQQWKRIPAERVAEVERITGISRHELREDIFGPAPSEAPSA